MPKFRYAVEVASAQGILPDAALIPQIATPDNLDGSYIGCGSLLEVALIMARMPLDGFIHALDDNGEIRNLTQEEEAEWDGVRTAVDALDPDVLRFG